MMARMAAEQVQAGGSAGRLPALVSAYARRVSSAVLEQHRAASVSSALGVWLLLAACVSAAQGSDRAELEKALGCSAEEASRLLAALMGAPPPALRAALAAWVRIDDAAAEVTDWVAGLPDNVSSGFMPTQAEADAWAERETLGLIRNLPLKIDHLTRIVLASALATKVSWEVPFGVVPAAAHLGAGEPLEVRGVAVAVGWRRRGPRDDRTHRRGRAGGGALRGRPGGPDRCLGVGRARDGAVVGARRCV